MSNVCDRCGTVHSGCSAHNQLGQPCGKRACIGLTVCASHGGANPNAVAKRQRFKEEEAARRELSVLGRPQSVDPGQALLDLISWKHAEVVALRQRVQDVGESDLVWSTTEEADIDAAQWPGTNSTRSATPHVWWRMLREAENQLAAFASAAHRAGIAEREVRLAEKQGEMVAGVIRRVLARLDLSAAQQVLVGQVVPAELRALAGTVVP